MQKNTMRLIRPVDQPHAGQCKGILLGVVEGQGE